MASDDHLQVLSSIAVNGKPFPESNASTDISSPVSSSSLDKSSRSHNIKSNQLSKMTSSEGATKSDSLSPSRGESGPEEQQKQQQQTRFSFYDAQEVELQYATTSFSSLLMPLSANSIKGEEENDKNHIRYNFYDPSAVVVIPDIEVPAQEKTKKAKAKKITSNYRQQQPPHLQQFPEQQQQQIYPHREELAPVDSNATLQQQHNTDDILKSLLETEEQRMQILKPHATPAAGRTSSNRNYVGVEGPTAFDSADSDVARNVTTASEDGNISNSGHNGSGNPYEDAIREALDLLRKHRSPPPSPYALAPGATGAPDAAVSSEYHTPHDAVESLLPGIVADTERSRWTGMVTLSPYNRDRTPKEQDRLLQHRRDDDHVDQTDVDGGGDRRVAGRYKDGHHHDDDDDHDAENLLASVGSQEENLADALQEVKLKAKKRQERMAEYASRLQEFKSSLPPEQQSHLHSSSKNQILNSPSHKHQEQQQQPSPYESSSSPQHQSSSGSLGIPAPPTATTSNFATTVLPASVAQPPPIHHVNSMTDVDSVGLMSELSQSTKPAPPPSSYYHLQSGFHEYPEYHNHLQHQRVTVESEVQKGVEKVLLAILEASKSKGGDASSKVGGGGGAGGTGLDTSSTHSGSGHISETLLKVMDEVLHPTRSISSYSNAMMGGSFSHSHRSGETMESSSRRSGIGPDEQRVGGWSSNSSKISVSAKSQESHKSKRSGGERSVVEELLAESDDDEVVVPAEPRTTSNAVAIAPQEVSSQVNAVARYPQHYPQQNEDWPREEKKMTEERVSSEVTPLTGSTKKTSKKYDAAEDKNIDALIEESLRGSHRAQDMQDEEEDDVVSASEDDEGEDDDVNTEPDNNESFEEDDEDDVEEEEEVDGRKVGRVLGPLSRKAGGTTGVVLDSESGADEANTQGQAKKGYFASVVNYVASALTPDQQRILDDKRKSEVNERQRLENMSTQDMEDMEAMELMRTLCAHLLPYGVDQKSKIEDSIPAWDEDNVNEAGYRIIRLSKSQLRRVERAFDTMITGLKLNSQSQLTGVEGEYDANFIRELQEAERLLDDEEKRNLFNVSRQQIAKVTSAPKPAIVEPIVEQNDNDPKQMQCLTEGSHPDFPGIRTAGKGEMGDLEYFQLPIIFKSHVTGFEPTKDMVLEPGNVVAGQYLVESELGSAAFSTAYRCIDLSSDDNDGHEEVCLKVIKNTKDFFDQSLDEIKILELLRQTGKCDENYIIRMKTFFYYREHLVIVTELLRQNLFEFGKFIIDNEEETYFTVPRLAYITRQCLTALKFVHSLGLVHSDVKPENILLGSYSRAQIKLIDFGSSCYLTDRQSSYIQSRSYRAPEVVLGLPYDGKIDVWSLGCVVAEMFTGDVTFQNDSIVSMLSRIEAICGSFPRHMIAQGRQSGRFFTKSGLLYEAVDDSDQEGQKNPPGPADNDSDTDADSIVQFDIFQPKYTRLSSRLGFDADLMDGYGVDVYSNKGKKSDRQIKQMFTDFVARLLTIDPDGRPTADEALQHPWMIYAASLTEDQIKYPSS